METAVLVSAIVVPLVGIVVWYNKTVIPDMMKAHRDDIMTATEAGRADLMGCVVSANARMDRELEKRDAALKDTTDRLVSSINVLSTRIDKLGEKTS